jgi:prolyl-tRNA synthetase
VAPFAVHLIDIPSAGSGQVHRGQEVYEALTKAGIEVLWDDRDLRPGEKFADADLLGIPYRLVVSAKTGEMIEVKKRTENTTTLKSLDEVLALW